MKAGMLKARYALYYAAAAALLLSERQFTSPDPRLLLELDLSPLEVALSEGHFQCPSFLRACGNGAAKEQRPFWRARREAFSSARAIRLSRAAL